MTSSDEDRPPTAATSREDAMAHTIRAYLRQHPHAKDTLDGILHYWLERQRIAEEAAMLQRVVGRLVREGSLREERRAGVVYYALADGGAGPAAGG